MSLNRNLLIGQNVRVLEKQRVSTRFCTKRQYIIISFTCTPEYMFFLCVQDSKHISGMFVELLVHKTVSSARGSRLSIKHPRYRTSGPTNKIKIIIKML